MFPRVWYSPKEEQRHEEMERLFKDTRAYLYRPKPWLAPGVRILYDEREGHDDVLLRTCE